MWHWLSGQMPTIIGTVRIMSAVGPTNLVRLPHAMSTIRVTRSPILKIAIVVLILFSALSWLRITAFASTKQNRGRDFGLSTLGNDLKITAEIDIFSGRRNPSWKLRPAQASTLIRMLEQIGRSDPARQPCLSSDLGYRGLILSVESDSQVTTWRLFEGCAQRESQSFSDPHRRTEAFILESMPPQLKQEFSAVLPQLNQ
jgi:hypothetical protein